MFSDDIYNKRFHSILSPFGAHISREKALWRQVQQCPNFKYLRVAAWQERLIQVPTPNPKPAVRPGIFWSLINPLLYLPGLLMRLTFEHTCIRIEAHKSFQHNWVSQYDKKPLGGHAASQTQHTQRTRSRRKVMKPASPKPNIAFWSKQPDYRL